MFLAMLCIVVNSVPEIHEKTNHLYSSDLDNQYVVLAPVLVLHVYPICLMLILFGGGL